MLAICVKRIVMKRAIIIGVTGQDGSYLAELLLKRDYDVHGILGAGRGYVGENINGTHISADGTRGALQYHTCDTSDARVLTGLIHAINPDEVYHFETRGSMNSKYDMREFSGDITGLSSMMVLEAVKQSGVESRYCQASSCGMYGSTPPPQNEISPYRPHTPHECANLMSHLSAVNYREAYELYASCAILFNHESPRRGDIFVSRKITRSVARIKASEEQYLILGDLNPEMDWGYAPEYVEVMSRMLERDRPGDYVIGTGESHSVREFVEEAFSYAGLDWEEHVRIDPRYFRSLESNELRADSARAREKLGWEPKIGFRDLVRIMVDADLRAQGLEPPGDGDRALAEMFPERWWKTE